MSNLREIDDAFVDEYILTHRNKLGRPVMGGTDWRFADIVAPAFKEILEIAQPENILEIGFNAGGSALMFLSIDPSLEYCSVDIQENKKSIDYLSRQFKGFSFVRMNSKNIDNKFFCFSIQYDMGFIDGDHSWDGVVNDTEKMLTFNPKYILYDDVQHPSHLHIYDLITNKYKEKLDVVKLFDFNQCWKGYSMALCKVK